jgi:glucan biosynthesis protein C
MMTTSTARYHGLDAMRGIAMVLGIALHAALPYIPGMPSAIWPSDNSSSYPIKIVFEFIHMWRMPVFFILAGFFANLIITRKSWMFWCNNRFLRVGLPIAVFFPVMSLTLPWIWKYGRTGEFYFFYSNTGQPFHLWFLWHLLIFVLFSILFRMPGKFLVALMRLLNGGGLEVLTSFLYKLKNVTAVIIFKSKCPIGFMLACGITNLWAGGELIINPLGSGLYFLFGFSLYKNPSLLSFIKKEWKYYLLIATLIFSLYIALDMRVVKDITEVIYQTRIGENQTPNISLFVLTRYSMEIIGAVLFSMGFIGLAEDKFGSYNRFSRFISDGSYWMYLIHLPVVTFTTFLMFGWLIYPEIKFVIATSFTAGVCLVTYRYFVQATFIGLFLNGKRHRGSNFGNVCPGCGMSFRNPERFCTGCGSELAR